MKSKTRKDDKLQMIHQMNLHNGPFQMILNRQKTIELRLYDEKRSKISVGDKIEFTNTSAPYDTLTVVVEHIYKFPTFEELYHTLPLGLCGYKEEELQNAKASDMLAYYTLEQQKKYGVLGIAVKLL